MQNKNIEKVKLGFAVKILGENLPSNDSRRAKNNPSLQVSLDYINQILDYLDQKDIRMYRMSSDLAPYLTHPDYPQFWNQLNEHENKLKEVGDKANSFHVRLSMHPGQYTVLNSEKKDTQKSAQKELDGQALLLQKMNLNYEACLILHIGGGQNDHKKALQRFEAGFDHLKEETKKRLILENDDRIFSVKEVYSLCKKLGTRMVYDNLHHYMNDPCNTSQEEAMEMALETWRDWNTIHKEKTRPKMHFSSPLVNLGENNKMPRLRSHSDFIDPLDFEKTMKILSSLATINKEDRAVDIMLEAKAKNLALEQLRTVLTERKFTWQKGHLLFPSSF